MSNATNTGLESAVEQFVENHDSVEDIFRGPAHNTVLGVAQYWLEWGTVGLFVLFSLFYVLQKLGGTCRWEVLYVSSIGGFVNLVTVLFEDYEPMT